MSDFPVQDRKKPGREAVTYLCLPTALLEAAQQNTTLLFIGQLHVADRKSVV